MRITVAMVVRRRLVAFLGAVLALTFAAPGLCGQSSLTDLTATPIAGAGRSYLTGLHEVVDPATGQLALRFPVMLPASRGFGLHFAVAYDSGTRVSYEPYENRTFANSYLYRDGWSYTVPNISYLYREVPSYGYNSYGDYVQLGTCDDLSDYVYSDDSGGRFDLGMERAWDPASTPPPNDACTNLNINGNSSPGGWNGGAAWFDPTRYDTDDVIDLSTNDGLQMTMLNPEHYRAGGTNVSPTTVALIDRLTDRNGNIYRIADNGNGKIVYSDSDGRTALSTSGFADSSDTITAAGGQTYTVTWQSGTAQVVSVPSRLRTDTTVGHTCSATDGLSTPSTSNGITRIQLPNGTAYTLEYDPVYGQISKLIYPSGAYVQYTWGFEAGSDDYAEFGSFTNGDGSRCDYMMEPLVITARDVSPDGGPPTLHQTFTYTAAAVTSGGYGPPATRTTTVRDYDGSGHLLATRVYTYDDTNGVRPQATTVQTENAQGVVVRTVQQSWPAAAVDMPPTAIVTTLDNGKVTKTVRSYNSFHQLIEQDDYDYGPGAPGPLLRKLVYSYLSDGNIPLSGAPTLPWIVDRPTLSEVFDGSSSTPASATIDCYDQASVASVSGLTAHDDTNFGVGQTNRGNLTQELRWLNPPGGSNALPTCGQATGSNGLSSSYSYDEAGQPLSVTDPGQHTTRYTWGDAAGSPSGTDGFLLQVQYPDTNSPNLAHHSESYTWDYLSGHLLTHTGQNGEVTSYQYSDPLGRLTQITDPLVPVNGGGTDNPVTKVSYGDTPGNLYTEVQRKIDSSTWTDAYTLYDGLGRAVSHSLADPDNGWDRTDTGYDGLGRVAFRSYPCPATSPTGAAVCTAGDTFAYDALGRTLTVTHSDQSQISYTYAGAATEVQDEGNGSYRVTHVYQHDGLGRLTSVCEVTGATGAGPDSTPTSCSGQIAGFPQDIAATGFETGYSYDARGDLTGVQQPGLLDRSFSYDSLGRLLSATNPEAGTASYSYDADGNLLTRTRPAPNQTDPNVTVTTAYTWDGLERLLTIRYLNDNAATPPQSFNYDQSAMWAPLANTIGRLSTVWTGEPAFAATSYSYDGLGRVVRRQSCAPNSCGTRLWNEQDGYDLLGDRTQETLPQAHGLSFAWNRAGRLTGVTETGSGASLLSQVRYQPAGEASATLGNGLAETRGYDGRGRWSQEQAGSLFGFRLAYAPDGALAGFTDLGNAGGSWSYAYDPLNRLVQANCGPGCPLGGASALQLNWSYDRFGNRWSQASPSPGATVSQPSFSFTGQNNRIDAGALLYDAAGNLVADGTYSYRYNAENQLSAVSGNGVQLYYQYDAAGRRIYATGTAGATVYVYDAAGHVNSYAAASGALLRQEVYAGARHLATWSASGLSYSLADQLGTERVRTDAAGAATEGCISLPFGDDQYCWEAGGTDPSPLHFTGKPRDAETGLDDFGARLYSSSLGRWMTPDDGSDQDPGDPQSWNLYSYVRNNPVSNADPDGHTCITTDNGTTADNMDGKGCAQLDDTHQIVTVTAKPGNAIGAFFLNFGFALDNAANNYFSWMFTQRPQTLANTPVSDSGVGTTAKVAAFVGSGLVGPEGEIDDGIIITEKGLQHVLDRHTVEGIRSMGKSTFEAGEDIKALIHAAASTPRVPQGSGAFERIVDAGRVIGIDRSTGQPTSVYTVITDAVGRLVTAFPGRP